MMTVAHGFKEVQQEGNQLKQSKNCTILTLKPFVNRQLVNSTLHVVGNVLKKLQLIPDHCGP
jgi:hypothetical protein